MTDTILTQIQNVIDSRKGGNPDASYVAQLLHKGEDKILKKVIEEAGETLMASKDGGGEHLVYEVADLWFHTMVLLAHHGLRAEDVVNELARRQGLSGLVEKASRKESWIYITIPYLTCFRIRLLGQKRFTLFSETRCTRFQTAIGAIMDNCIFCKIATKDIPAQTVYEDDEMLCFKDIRPAAPVHLLLIPKVHFDSLAHATAEHQTLLGKMMLKVPQIAQEAGLTSGFKTLINTGKGGGQEVFHLHIHIMGTPA